MSLSAVESAASSLGAVGIGIGSNIGSGQVCRSGCRACIRDLAGADTTRPKPPDYTSYVGDDYGPYRDMIAKLEKARGVGNWVPHGYLGSRAAPAAVTRDFKDQPINLGIANLHGCTSVIVVSRKGVWASHFWEVPSFKTRVGPGPYDCVHVPDTFKRDVLGTLDYGCVFDQHPNRECGGIGSYSRDDSSMFAEDYRPRVIIVTPREKTYSPPPREGVLEFPDQVRQIKKKLRKLLPSSPPPLVVDYFSNQGPDRRVKNPANPEGFSWVYGTVLLEYNPEEYLVTPRDGRPRQFSGITITVAARKVPLFYVWKSLPCQEVRVTRQGGDARTFAEVCRGAGGASPTTDATSATPTSQVPPTTTERSETPSADPSTADTPASTEPNPPQDTNAIDPAAADALPEAEEDGRLAEEVGRLAEEVDRLAEEVGRLAEEVGRLDLRQQPDTHDDPGPLVSSMRILLDGSTTPNVEFHPNRPFAENEDGTYTTEYTDH